ncbi:MAG: L-threonylcarbamoyladenylate synthase [Thermodesulfobacteriota bacterium]
MPTTLKPDGPFDKAVTAFKKGGVIAYPTETFYGLGVDPFNEEAVRGLFTLKGRPPENPVSVIVRDREMLRMVVEEVPPLAERLIEYFWPGPLTIILKARDVLPPTLTAGTGTVGVRESSSDTAMKLVTALGSPITATSANPSGKPPAATADEAAAYFGDGIDILIDGGKTGGGLGSTVVDATGEEIEIIREGEIPASEILTLTEKGGEG